MKKIYIVLQHYPEYHYGNVSEQTCVDGMFESIEDAEAYIESRSFPDDYELVDWVDYYESGAKEKFGW